MEKPRTKPGIHQRTYRGKVMRLLEGSTEFAGSSELSKVRPVLVGA